MTTRRKDRSMTMLSLLEAMSEEDTNKAREKLSKEKLARQRHVASARATSLGDRGYKQWSPRKIKAKIQKLESELEYYRSALKNVEEDLDPRQTDMFVPDEYRTGPLQGQTGPGWDAEHVRRTDDGQDWNKTDLRKDRKFSDEDRKELKRRKDELDDSPVDW